MHIYGRSTTRNNYKWSDINIDNKEQQENNKIDLKEQSQKELYKNNNEKEEIKSESQNPNSEETKNIILSDKNENKDDVVGI